MPNAFVMRNIIIKLYEISLVETILYEILNFDFLNEESKFNNLFNNAM